MSTMYPPQPPVAVRSSGSSGIKTTMTVFSAIGLAIWGTSIGVLMGWINYDVYTAKTMSGAFVSIPANAGMIYVACRLIFLVTNRNFPSTAALQDLHQCVARMVAFTVLGFTMWVTSVVWLIMNGEWESLVVFHACQYGFVLGTIVAGLAGGVLSASSRGEALPVHAAQPKYAAPSSQAHYNQGYAHH